MSATIEGRATETADDGDDGGYARAVREARLRDIALVAASPWFDPDWYLQTYPDVLIGGVEPAEHFVDYGAREGRDPSPFFSSNWYITTYPDVAEADLNPLVHYLNYGATEGRPPNDTGLQPRPRSTQPAAVDLGPGGQPTPTQLMDAELVRKSPLFDEQWYRRRYAEALADVRDPALHFVSERGMGNVDPGPRFSSSWYLEHNPDVAATGLNPLVHYLRYGRSEGRAGAPERVAGANLLDPDAAAAAAERANGDRPPSPMMQPATGELDVRLAGTSLGLLRQGGSASGANWIQALLAFARLARWDERNALQLHGPERDEPSPALDILSWSLETRFAATKLEIVDAWLVSDVALRFRWEVTGQGEFGAEHVVRFHQSVGDALVACGESVLRGESPAFVDAVMANPYKPLLATVTDRHGALAAVAMLPFPSLCRGGPHHAEVAASGERASRAADQVALAETLCRELLGWGEDASDLSLARLDIDITDATGAERIFQPALRDWLGDTVGLATEAVGVAVDARLTAHLKEALAGPRATKPRSSGSCVLRIGPNSLPSIAALVSRRLPVPGAAPLPGPFLVADAATGRPRLHVAVPPVEGLTDVQPADAPLLPSLAASGPVAAGGGAPAHPAVPLAIRFRRPVAQAPRLFMPTAPDSTRSPLAHAPEGHRRRISAIVIGRGGADSFEPLLASLADQTVADDIDVIAITDLGDQAGPLRAFGEALLPSRFHIEPATRRSPAARLNAAAMASRGEHLLFLDAAMLLHDRRTVEVLAGLLLRDDVFSAGCSQMLPAPKGAEASVVSGAFFPTRIALTRDPHLVFEEPLGSALAIEGTFPVAANNLRATLVSTAAFRSLGGFDEVRCPVAGHDLEIGLRAVRNGLVNLNTTAVAVLGRTPRRELWAQDMLAANYLPPQRWQDLVGSVTVMRELH